MSSRTAPARLPIGHRLWWFWHRTRPAFAREILPRAIANRLPRRVMYFAMIRAWAAATPGDRHPDETSAHACVAVYEEPRQ